MTPRGRSVRLFLAEGTSSGILTAEIGNWTGHAVAGPRTRLEAAIQRPELRRTGIYLIFGDSQTGDLPAVYVGEGDDVSQRLKSHSADPSKDYWERFVVLTSKDANLTKAHVRYLEAAVIRLLHEAKKSVVKNGTSPTFERLPESDVADMESFLDEMQLLLPVIGFDLLRRPPKPVKGTDSTAESPNFILENAGKKIKAFAAEVQGEFVLRSGSVGSLNESVSFHDRIKTIRDQVLESGRAAKIDSDTFRLIDDVAFSSPSAAAVFLFGTSRNGRTDWLVEGKSLTYGDWKDAQLIAMTGTA